MKILKIAGVLALLSFSSIAIAQVLTDSLKGKQLTEVVITGTKTLRGVATLPLPTQIITKESIQKSGLSRLNEVIQEQTGLITVPDFGGGEGIQIQGLDAAYVMILIDGQPLFGRSAGTLDLGRISVNNIERIEIVKGASSCLYGSEALAGVVNIITREPSITENLKGSANYKLATFNTHDVSGGLEYGKGKIGIELFGNYFKTEGYNLSESDFLQTVEPYYNFSLHPKVKIKFSDQLHLLTSSRFYQQNQDYKAEIGAIPATGDSKVYEWNSSSILNHAISKRLKMVYDIYATNYKAHEFLHDPDGMQLDESSFNQWFYRYEVRSHYKIGRNTLSSGVGMNYETLERTYFEKEAKLKSEYIFGQLEWFIRQKWNALLGFRYDHHHQYQSQFSPKVGLNFEWNKRFSLKTSIGYGYKAPDLRQLYFDFTNSMVGYTVLGYNVAEERLGLMQSQGQLLFSNSLNFSNPLKPESSVNFNFGGYYHARAVDFDFNIFHNTIQNLVDTRAVAQKSNGQNVFSYFNIDKIFTYGLELNANYKINKDISISTGYQYLIAKDQSVVDNVRQGEVFARNPVTLSSFQLNTSDYFGLYNRSRHMANAKLNYLIPAIKTTVNARVFYKSKYGIFDSNSNTVLDRYDTFVNGYFLSNLAITKDIKHQISLLAGINNLLGYTDRNNVSNLPGRQFFTKITYQF